MVKLLMVFFFWILLQYNRRMQRQFIISMISQSGKKITMEVKQKYQQVTKRKVKTWTNQEDNNLLQLYQQFPKKWADIANYMPDRNQNQCLHRYRRLSQLGKGHKIWSAEEDQMIKKLIKKFGKNWKLLSQMLGSKNGKQIRERFINKLDPRIKKEDWSEQQDRKILQIYSKIGSKWSQISKNLPGRPENKIKNRFYSFIKKNYDIHFRQIQSESDLVNCAKQQHQDSTTLPLNPVPSQKGYVDQQADKGALLANKRQQSKILEIYSKAYIPSINNIDFDYRNDKMASNNNFLQSIIQIQDWKSYKNCQSIIDLQSHDYFFRFHN